jgi:hypothetical protein
MTPLEKALDRLANGHYLKSMEELPSDDCRFSIVTVTFVDDEKFTFPSCVLPEYIINNIQFYHKLRKIYQYEAIGKLNDFLQDRFADYPEEPFVKSVEAPNEH